MSFLVGLLSLVTKSKSRLCVYQDSKKKKKEIIQYHLGREMKAI